jgi:hypothetical protein
MGRPAGGPEVAGRTRRATTDRRHAVIVMHGLRARRLAVSVARTFGFMDARVCLVLCDILAQGLIGLIGYSYQQDIPSFLEAHLKRTSG